MNGISLMNSLRNKVVEFPANQSRGIETFLGFELVSNFTSHFSTLVPISLRIFLFSFRGIFFVTTLAPLRGENGEISFVFMTC